MSKGVSRNEAARLAAYYNSKNIPYKKAYAREQLTLYFSSIAKTLSNSIEVAGAAFSDLAIAVKKAIQKSGGIQYRQVLNNGKSEENN